MAALLASITSRRFVFALLIAVSNQILISQSTKQASASSSLWLAIRMQLSSPNNRQFFEENIENSAMPTLYGTLVSSSPVDHPDVFLIAMDGKTNPEIRLRLTNSLLKPLPPGTRIAFAGIAESFTVDPFLLTLRVEELQAVVDVPVRPKKKR